MAVNFRGTFSFTPGATMRGCFVLIVRVPVVPLGEEVLVGDDVVEIEPVVVLDDDDTIGMATKNAPEMMRTTTAKPASALIPGRCFSKQKHPRVAEFISFPKKLGFCSVWRCSERLFWFGWSSRA